MRYWTFIGQATLTGDMIKWIKLSTHTHLTVDIHGKKLTNPSERACLGPKWIEMSDGAEPEIGKNYIKRSRRTSIT